MHRRPTATERPTLPAAESVLVVLADGDHLTAAKQTLASAVTHGGWRGERLVLTTCRDESRLGELRREGVLVERPHTGDDVRRLKLALFGEHFRRWRNVVYLDADTIVTGPVDHLGRVRGFWAASDFYLCLGEQFTRSHELLARAYDLRALSFNTGVMAFSTDVIEGGTRDRLEALYDEYRESVWGFEQPILNLHFCERWRRLSQAYNFFSIMPRSVIANSRTASILHFPGPDKPWLEGHPYQALWAANLARFGSEGVPRATWNGRFRRAMAPAYFLCLWQLRRYLRNRCPTIHGVLRRLRGRKPGLWSTAADAPGPRVAG